MNLIKIYILMAALATCALFAGCTSNDTPNHIKQYNNMPQQQYDRYASYSLPQASCLATTPDKASVFLNWNYMGITPSIGFSARHGDTIVLYKPGYDAAVFNVQADGPVNTNIPLFPSNPRYFSLLSSSNAKFIQTGGGIVLEATGAKADTNSSFVIFDKQYGGDIRLTVIESNSIYIRFKAMDGMEFCYPVNSQTSIQEPYSQYPQQQYFQQDKRIMSSTQNQQQQNYIGQPQQYPQPHIQQYQPYPQQQYPAIQSGFPQ